jgi:hypothetical protein
MCHTESTVAAFKWIVLGNRVACPNSLVRNLLQQLQHKWGVVRHKCGVMRRSEKWCGVARNAAFRRNVQAFARCVAYLHTPQICRACRGVKVGIHGLLNWTAENLYLGSYPRWLTGYSLSCRTPLCDDFASLTTMVTSLFLLKETDVIRAKEDKPSEMYL